MGNKRAPSSPPSPRRSPRGHAATISPARNRRVMSLRIASRNTMVLEPLDIITPRNRSSREPSPLSGRIQIPGPLVDRRVRFIDQNEGHRVQSQSTRRPFTVLYQAPASPERRRTVSETSTGSPRSSNSSRNTPRSPVRTRSRTTSTNSDVSYNGTRRQSEIRQRNDNRVSTRQRSQPRR
jgi:hypothetical protein